MNMVVAKNVRKLFIELFGFRNSFENQGDETGKWAENHVNTKQYDGRDFNFSRVGRCK